MLQAHLYMPSLEIDNTGTQESFDSSSAGRFCHLVRACGPSCCFSITQSFHFATPSSAVFDQGVGLVSSWHLSLLLLRRIWVIVSGWCIAHTPKILNLFHISKNNQSRSWQFYRARFKSCTNIAWCQLGPISKVKLDSDAEPAMASYLRVGGLPTVNAFFGYLPHCVTASITTNVCLVKL